MLAYPISTHYEVPAPPQRRRLDFSIRMAAKCKKDGLKLELLVSEIGAPDKYHTYEIKTGMRDDVYVRGSDGAVTVSQQEYKEKWAK